MKSQTQKTLIEVLKWAGVILVPALFLLESFGQFIVFTILFFVLLGLARIARSRLNGMDETTAKKVRTKLNRTKNGLLLIAFFCLAGVGLVGLASSARESQSSHKERGLALMESGRFEKAISEFETVTQTYYYHYIATDESKAYILHLLGKTYCQLGEFDKALLCYKESISHSDMYSPLAYENLTEGLRKVHEFEQAPQSVQESPESLIALAQIYDLLMGCDRKALELCRKAVAMPLPEKLQEKAREYLQELENRYQEVNADLLESM